MFKDLSRRRFLAGSTAAAGALSLGSRAAFAADPLKVGFVYVGPVGDGGWRIVDTIRGGTASELAARRSEYDGIVRKLGIEALIQALKDKTAGFAAE